MFELAAMACHTPPFRLAMACHTPALILCIDNGVKDDSGTTYHFGRGCWMYCSGSLEKKWYGCQQKDKKMDEAGVF